MANLKERLINKIRETTDPDVLQEVYRLLEIQFDDQEVYQLSDDKKSVVNEAQEQIQRGEFLTNEKAYQEIEEWLKKK